MRTTLILDDDLAREAKHRAADLGLTLSGFVNRALRDALRPSSPAAESPFQMITYGSSEPGRGLDPAEVEEILHRQDATPIAGD